MESEGRGPSDQAAQQRSPEVARFGVESGKHGAVDHATQEGVGAERPACDVIGADVAAEAGQEDDGQVLLELFSEQPAGRAGIIGRCSVGWMRAHRMARVVPHHAERLGSVGLLGRDEHPDGFIARAVEIGLHGGDASHGRESLGGGPAPFAAVDRMVALSFSVVEEDRPRRRREDAIEQAAGGFGDKIDVPFVAQAQLGDFRVDARREVGVAGDEEEFIFPQSPSDMRHDLVPDDPADGEGVELEKHDTALAGL